MFEMTTSELQRALRTLEGADVHQVTLSEWARSGILTPSAQQGKRGRNWGHRYTVADLLRARLLVRLRQAGIPTRRAVAIVAALGEALPAIVRRRGVELVVEGYRAIVVRTIGGAGLPPVELPFGQQRLPLSGLVLSEDKLRKLIAA